MPDVVHLVAHLNACPLHAQSHEVRVVGPVDLVVFGRGATALPPASTGSEPLHEAATSKRTVSHAPALLLSY